jgi:hypothetical protein
VTVPGACTVHGPRPSTIASSPRPGGPGPAAPLFLALFRTPAFLSCLWHSPLSLRSPELGDGGDRASLRT